MTTETILLLQNLMDYCNDRWVEADRTPDAAFPTPGMLAGKKMAYNDILQFARRKLGEITSEP